MAHPSGTTDRQLELPPGQRELSWFPRFGRDISTAPPPVQQHPALLVAGVVEPLTVPLVELAGLPRREIVADFHCVAGWSVRGLRWGGVAFADFYSAFVQPEEELGRTISHVRFRGADGVVESAELGDVLAPDVLLADQLDGQTLDGDHGAPLRLISPAQYGYLNVKHLVGVDFLSERPPPARSLADRLLASHPRGRVWHEERHAAIPGRIVRPIYQVIKAALLRSSRAAADHHLS